MAEDGRYMATRRMVEMGVIYETGETTNLTGLTEDRKIYLLGRGFFVPVNGYDSLTGEFGKKVREALG